MKVFTWNVERRVQTTLERQLKLVLARRPDVVALQELKEKTYPDWCRGLTREGYSVVSSVDLLALEYPEPPYPSPPFPEWDPETQGHIQREPFNLIAARHPMAMLRGLAFENAQEAQFAFPEKYIAARVMVDGTEIDVHNAHLPHGSGRGAVKVHAFEAIRRRIHEDTDNPRILCGDFNAPWSENADGPIIECGGPWPEDIRARWDEAERALLANPQMRDVYRDVHDPTQPFPASYFTGRKEPRTPHRYDLVFASSELVTESCAYLTEWLDRDADNWRPSDHAPVEAELRPR